MSSSHSTIINLLIGSGDWKLITLKILCLAGSSYYILSKVLANYKIRKWLDRMISGKSELQRLCEANDTDDYQIDECINQSKQLVDIKSRLLQHNINVEALSNQLMNSKRIPQHCYHRILSYVNNVHDYNQLIQLINQRKVSYDINNEQHEKILLDLWSVLKPNEILTSRRSEQWKAIGFQGVDPATDFRSMGILGLNNLLYFAQHYENESQAMLQETNIKSNWFSFSITGLNITADLVQLLNTRQLTRFFYERGSTEHMFFELYCILFVSFHEFWRSENPPNVMSFQEIHTKFIRDIVNEAANGYLATRYVEYRG